MELKEFRLKPSEYMILQYLKLNPICSGFTIAYDLSLTKKTVHSKLIILEKLGVISREIGANKPTVHKINPINEWVLD